jgi:DnaJ-class molecular chaperone
MADIMEDILLDELIEQAKRPETTIRCPKCCGDGDLDNVTCVQCKGTGRITRSDADA